MLVKLIRIVSSEKLTFGIMTVNNHPLCVTLERPWLNNKNDISCIPCGRYEFYKCKSPTKNKQVGGSVYRAERVEGREGILIHIGNFVTDTLGCILVGMEFDEENILRSTEAMRKVLATLPDKFTLDIHDATSF